MIRFCIILIFLLKTPLVSAEIDYFSAENLHRFADHLYDSGDFERAIGEYNRLLIAWPDSVTTRDYQRLVECYERVADYHRALGLVRNRPFFAGSDSCRWFRREARLLFRLEHYDDLTHSWFAHPLCASDSTRVLLGFRDWRHRQWAAAEQHFQQLADDFANRQFYLSLTHEAQNLPHKSPLAAGVLSAVMPGAGRLYLGRWADALMSFVTSGVTIWQAYEHFDEDGWDSTNGWIYSGLGLFFYGGNVYGSYMSARIDNYRHNAHMELKLETTIRLYLD